MSGNEPTPSSKLPAGARFGVLFGFHAWLIPLFILAIGAGSWELARAGLLVAVPATFGLAFLVLLIARLIEPHRGSNAWRLCFVGTVLLAIGLMLVVANGSVGAVIQTDEDLKATMRSLQGVWLVPPVIPMLLMLAGGVLVALGGAKLPE